MSELLKPKLRFKKDDGSDFPDWEESSLGDIGEIVTGKTPSTSDSSLWDGDIQFVTPTDINAEKYQNETIRTVVNHSKLKILPKSSIMFTCIGSSIGKMTLSSKPCITNQQINSLIPTSHHNNEFIYYGLLGIKEFIKSKQSISTIPIINKTEFSNFILFMPCKLEQDKIASFLSAVDKKIELLCKKHKLLEKYKKGLMQKIFSQEIRFKKDDGSDFADWKNKSLNELISINHKSSITAEDIKKNHSDDYPNPAFTSGSTIYNANDNIIEGDNIFMSTGGIANIFFHSGKALYSTDTFSFSGTLNTKYIYYYLQNKLELIDYKYFYGSGLKHLDKKYFLKINIPLPDLNEQNKICSFLSFIDKKMDLTEMHIDGIKTFKKGLLQQMLV